MNTNNPIGVFDSGIGGLSVLKQLIRFMPHEKYIYLGDNARVPYGNKSEEIVKQYSRECTEFLLNKHVKLVVVACNTASSVAMDAVREKADGVPVIGMIEPAAAAALRETNNKKIGVIGTRATVNSEAYVKGIHNLNNDKEIRVFSKACPLFVPLVEEGWTKHPIARQIAEEYLADLKKVDIDALVLGCTHYPSLNQLLTEILPKAALIDSGEHASVTALRLLAEQNILREETKDYHQKPDIDFYVTDLPSMFFDLAKQFLGFPVDSPTKISLGSV